MTGLYLPRTLAELETMVSDGRLVEGQHFDAKALLGDGAKANTSLAIDLAAMSVAGGLIAIGVAEAESTLSVAPIELAGLRERVSQVAGSRPDPAIYPTTRELPATEDGRGVLLVIVPPSPVAPHQVDGKYRGRADTTNYVMGDAEVRRVQTERRASRSLIQNEVGAVIARDPLRDGATQAHLFVVGRPAVHTDPTMLQSRIGAWRDWIGSVLLPPVQLRGFAPSLASVNDLQRRPTGWAAVAGGLSPTRTLTGEAREAELIELEVDEDGVLRLYCARASDTAAAEGIRWVIDDLVTGLTWSIVRAAATVADASGYVGNWEFGLGITNARGLRSWAIRQRHSSLQYGADQYVESTVATPAEVADERDAVVARLLARWNRALTDDVVPITTFG